MYGQVLSDSVLKVGSCYPCFTDQQYGTSQLVVLIPTFHYAHSSTDHYKRVEKKTCNSLDTSHYHVPSTAHSTIKKKISSDASAEGSCQTALY